jgi:formylglycine-generating enzyme required for sulfatase activity
MKAGSRRHGVLVVLVALLTVMMSGPTPAQERVALVIGNGDYSQSGLPSINGPDNDAAGMAAALTDIGFEVIVGTNLGVDEMQGHLARFAARLRPGTEGLVYYSGHGVQVEGQNYLVPVDVRARYAEDVEAVSVSLDEVLDIGEVSGLATLIVILDACRDPGLPRRSGAAVAGLAPPDVRSGSLIAYATRPNDIARGALDRYSIYTGELLQRIREPGLVANRLFEEVRTAVTRITRGQQVPNEWTALMTPFRFVEGYCPAAPEFRDCEGCPLMVSIPAGSFTMGADDGPREARPARRLDVEHRFAIGKHEVTFEEWDRCVMEGACRAIPDDGGWGRSRRPAINVEWDDAQRFVRWLARRTGKPYRLPSEAQWEYAARGGTSSAFWWGDGAPAGRANCDGCGSQWGGQSTAPVGSFPPNPYGLYDVHGNVFEWVEDCWHPSYVGAPDDLRPRVDGACASTVVRGGSWRYGSEAARVDARGKHGAGPRDDFGFRVLLSCQG